MNQNTFPCDLSRVTCQAFGCLAQATIKIRVKIGNDRTMTLTVCKDCVTKFRED
jgi:hypothetical protein